MKQHRKSHKHKAHISDKGKRRITEFLQKYGMIIFALLAGLFLGKYIMPMFMR